MADYSESRIENIRKTKPEPSRETIEDTCGLHGYYQNAFRHTIIYRESGHVVKINADTHPYPHVTASLMGTEKFNPIYTSQGIVLPIGMADIREHSKDDAFLRRIFQEEILHVQGVVSGMLGKDTSSTMENRKENGMEEKPLPSVDAESKKERETDMGEKTDSLVVDTWTVDDVSNYAKKNSQVKLSRTGCCKVLQRMKENFDFKRGYTWDEIGIALSDIVEDGSLWKEVDGEALPDVLEDRWFLDDVRSVVKEMNCSFVPALTDEECMAVLHEASRRFDANDGINLYVLQGVVDDLYEDRKREPGLALVTVTAYPYVKIEGNIFAPSYLMDDQYRLEEYCEEHFKDISFGEPEMDFRNTDVSYDLEELASVEGIPAKDGKFLPETKEQLASLVREKEVPLEMVDIKRMKDVSGMEEAFSVRGNMKGAETWSTEANGAESIVVSAKKEQLMQKMRELVKDFRDAGFNRSSFIETACNVAGYWCSKSDGKMVLKTYSQLSKQYNR